MIDKIEALKVLDMFLHKQCDLDRTKFAYSQEEVWYAVKIAKEALEKQVLDWNAWVLNARVSNND